MTETTWIPYNDQEWEWNDALDAFTGNSRPLTKEMKQEGIRRGEDAARRIGWNGEYDPQRFGIVQSFHPLDDIPLTVDFVKTTTADKHPSEDSPGAKN